MKSSVAYSQNLSTIHCMRVCNSIRNTFVLISIKCENFVRIVAAPIMYSSISVLGFDCYKSELNLVLGIDHSIVALVLMKVCVFSACHFSTIPNSFTLFYHSLYTYSAFSELITIKADVRTYTIGFSFEVNWNLSFGLCTEHPMSYAKSLRVCVCVYPYIITWTISIH